MPGRTQAGAWGVTSPINANTQSYSIPVSCQSGRVFLSLTYRIWLLSVSIHVCKRLGMTSKVKN